MKKLIFILLLTISLCVYSEVTYSDPFGGEGAFGSIINFLKRVTTNIIPSIDATYDLGSSAKTWRYGYFGDLQLAGTGPDYTLNVTGGDTFGWHAESQISYWKNDTDNKFYWLADSLHNLQLVPYTTNGMVGINKGLSNPAYNLDVTGTGRFTSTLKIGAYTLPATDGTNGQQLTTDGVGNITFGSASGVTVSDTTTINLTLTGSDISADGLYTAGDDLTLTAADFDVDATVTRDTEWDTEAEVQTAWGAVNILLETEIDASSELLALMDDETGTGALTFATSPTFTTQITTPKIVSTGDLTIDAVNAGATSTVYILNSGAGQVANLDVEGDLNVTDITVVTGGTLQLGANGIDGLLKIYSEQGVTDYIASLYTNTAMTSAASFFLPADEPVGTYLLNMTTGGVIGYDSSTYLTTVDISANTNLAVSTPITLTGDSVGMVNQGTTTTVLHGNAAGNPSFGAVVSGDITNGTIVYADIQDISATSRVLGRITALAGVTEELTGANLKTIIGDVALTTDTSGNYVTDVTAGVGLSKTSSASEGQTVDLVVATTEIEATTWGAGGNASNIWSFNVSGTDWTMTAGSALATFSAGVTVSGTTTVGTLAGAIDAGGATSLEVPNGANPTVSVGGQVSVDTSATSGSALRFYGDAQYTLPAWQKISFVLLVPVATDDYSICSFPANITIKQIRVLCLSGTNIIGGLDEADANGATPVAIDADITASAGTTATDDGTLTNATVDANDMLNWHTTSISGTPTAVTVTVYFVWDAVN